ncbi:hypothetical protein PISMIDRAFT_619186 [Pisolithus microcarpus 441]|uniref:Uncharacterized protein n=1 Tax=Pisolithus microcarpus 441 TaxID=765257 RepID=A0A0C9ZAY4_9AGAM|nr:hypothetical protein PISMIDRAFT_619186 [Pisolithus microcarpus 441]
MSPIILQLQNSCHRKYPCHICLGGSSTHITSMRPSLSIVSNFPIFAHSSAVVDRRLWINFLVLPSGERGQENERFRQKERLEPSFRSLLPDIFQGAYMDSAKMCIMSNATRWISFMKIDEPNSWCQDYLLC